VLIEEKVEENVRAKPTKEEQIQAAKTPIANLDHPRGLIAQQIVQIHPAYFTLPPTSGE
jgi:hypothetical protein